MVATQILAIEPDAERQRAVMALLKQHGLSCKFFADGTKIAAALRQVTPEVILIHAEPGSPAVGAVLKAVLDAPGLSEVKIALLCRDLTAAPLAARMKKGVVALWEEALGPPLVAGVKELLAGTAARPGIFQGTGTGDALQRLLQQIAWMQWSGKVEAEAPGSKPAAAFFARGTAQASASRAALDALLLQRTVRWTVAEVSRETEEPEVVIALEDGFDEAVPILEEDDSEGVALEVDGADVLSMEDGAVDVRPPSSAPPPAPDEAGRPAPTLLLVDDDESLCRMFSLLFRRHHFEVTTAADGVEGFEVATQRKFDLVVADLMMPRLDGWGLLRQLRDDIRTRELPVAFLSCHDDFRESLRALDAGAQAYFSKTTRMEQLVGQVSALLEPRRALLRALAARAATTPVPVQLVGPQWLLASLGQQGFTGVLEAKDSWATYELVFSEGAPVAASALAGQHRAEGERAFNAFIASRGAEGTLRAGPATASPNLTLPLAALLERATRVLNENETRLREQLLVSAETVQVEPQLYALYRSIGPQAYLETARMICEDRLPAREVMSRAELSPLLVEDVMRDLIRRGVVTLRQ